MINPNLTRRELLAYGLAGTLLLFLAEKGYLRSGKLYFTNPDIQLSGEECTVLKDQVVRNFENAGIRFESAAVIDKDYPELKQLDMLIYIIDRIGPEESPMGLFGVDNQSYYPTIREKYGAPYSELESRANTGFVCPSHCIETFKSIPYLYINPNSRDDLLGWAVKTATHEAGHGLGASHVVKNVSGYGNMPHYTQAPNDFMSSVTEAYKGLSFCSENRLKMAKFIGTIRQRDYKPEEIIAIREKPLEKDCII